MKNYNTISNEVNKKGLILVFSTAIISGMSIFINKFGVSFSDPSVFTFLKNTTVAIILTGLLISLRNIKEIKRLDFKKWLMLAIIGLVGGSIPFLLFFKGLSITSAAQGSFIQKTMFLYVAVLAVIFLKEKINKYFLAGAIFLMLGNILILRNFSFLPNAGDLYILAATLFWAAENVISKYAMKEIKADIVAWGRMLLGSIFILAYLAATGQIQKVSSINPIQIGWVLVTAIFLFGYVVTWYRGLEKIPVTVATSVLLLGSPITTAMNIMSGGSMNIRDILSNILILAGVIIIAIFSYEEIQKNRGKFIRT
jgi:drug/metabolite transporter (DMT)-like permease